MKKTFQLICVLATGLAAGSTAYAQIGGAPAQNNEAFLPPERTPIPNGVLLPPGDAPGLGGAPPAPDMGSPYGTPYSSGAPFSPGAPYSPSTPYGGTPGPYGGVPGPYGPNVQGGPIEYAPFDPTLCDYRQPYGKFYVAADAMYWDRTEPFQREIALRAVGGVPRLRTSDPNFTHEVFPRLTFGYVCPNNWAIESSIYYKDDFDAIANYGETDMATAVWFGVQPEPSDWSSADQINLRLATGLHSYEINVINTIAGIQPILGIRYMEYRDRATMTAFDDANRSDGYIGTYNFLLGPQGGVRVGYDWGMVGIEGVGKVGWFYNDAKTSTLIRDINNTVTYRDVHRNGQNDACVFETGVMLYYRPVTCITARFGYQALGIINTAMAVDQISEVRSAAGNTTGIIPDAHGDIIFHGIHLGLEGRW
jgi:hypothetical protein